MLAADRKFVTDMMRAEPPVLCLVYVTPEQVRDY